MVFWTSQWYMLENVLCHVCWRVVFEASESPLPWHSCCGKGTRLLTWIRGKVMAKMFCVAKRGVEWEGVVAEQEAGPRDLVVRRRPVERSSHRCESPAAWQPSSSQGGGGRGKGRPTFWNLETSPPSAFPIQLSTLQLQTESRGKDSWTLQLNFPIWKSNNQSYPALKCNGLSPFKTYLLQNIVLPCSLNCVQLVLDLSCVTMRQHKARLKMEVASF